MADPATSFIIQTIYNVARGKVEREAAIIMGACRLLMIDKKGRGERPIAIGHIYRCLAGRFLERTSRKRRIEAFGPKQMATQPNGTTTAALSMHINIETVMNQETSQSLIPLSQTQDPGSSIAESSQSIIPHSQEYGLRSTDEDPGIDDIIEIYLRQTRRGRPVTKCGRVTEIKPNEPNRVK